MKRTSIQLDTFPLAAWKTEKVRVEIKGRVVSRRTLVVELRQKTGGHRS